MPHLSFGVAMPHNEELWHRYQRGDITKHQLTLERFGHLSLVRQHTEEEMLALNGASCTSPHTRQRLVSDCHRLAPIPQEPIQGGGQLSNGFTEVATATEPLRTSPLH